jgi:hypothetical protein
MGSLPEKRSKIIIFDWNFFFDDIIEPCLKKVELVLFLTRKNICTLKSPGCVPKGFSPLLTLIKKGEKDEAAFGIFSTFNTTLPDSQRR